jgi:hypothetical protein
MRLKELLMQLDRGSEAPAKGTEPVIGNILCIADDGTETIITPVQMRRLADKASSRSLNYILKVNNLGGRMGEFDPEDAACCAFIRIYEVLAGYREPKPFGWITGFLGQYTMHILNRERSTIRRGLVSLDATLDAESESAIGAIISHHNAQVQAPQLDVVHARQAIEIVARLPRDVRAMASLMVDGANVLECAHELRMTPAEAIRIQKTVRRLAIRLIEDDADGKAEGGNGD